jgi:hypothetical protein
MVDADDVRSRMDKARKFGWHGHVDSLRAIHQVMSTLAERNMIPPLQQTAF